MSSSKEILDSLALELRRGTVVLSVLSQLAQPQYGYSLVQSLEERGMSVEAGTLYPLLRRLEKQGLLASDWELGANKPRKYYSLTQMGVEVYKKLCAQWDELVEGMRRLTNGGANDA